MIIHDFVIPLIIVGLSVLLFVLLRPESNEEIDQNLNHKEGAMQEEMETHHMGFGSVAEPEEFFEMIDDSLSLHKDIHGVAPWVEDHFK